MSGLLPFHMGAFVAATLAGLPVVPVTIRGTRSKLRPDQWWIRPGPIHVTISPAIEPEGQDWRAAIRLKDSTRSVILSHCGEPDLAAER